MTIDGVDFNNLLKAFKKFEEFRLQLNSEQERAGAIQAFEYCFELVWKTMRRLLEARGIDVNSPKETFRLGAREKFIYDPEVWFDFVDMRNMTVHTYDENTAEKVINGFPTFAREVAEFLEKVKIHT